MIGKRLIHVFKRLKNLLIAVLINYERLHHPVNLEEMIRDRTIDWLLVYKIRAQRLDKLLREKDSSLDKALNMCKSSEITNKQLKSIQNDEKQ